jgi:hypothetical protein
VESRARGHLGSDTTRLDRLARSTALVAQLADRRLDPVERETYANGVRKLTYRDPDGNEIGLAVLHCNRVLFESAGATPARRR